MDIIILIGAGILGATLLANQSLKLVSTHWKLVLGGGGGLLAWAGFAWLDSLPHVPTTSGFIMMFILGSSAGALFMQFVLFLQGKIENIRH